MNKIVSFATSKLMQIFLVNYVLSPHRYLQKKNKCTNSKFSIFKVCFLLRVKEILLIIVKENIFQYNPEI